MRADREVRRIDQISTVLPVALNREMQRQKQQLDRISVNLGLLDPKLILQRGYAWLSDSDGHALTSVKNIAAGQALQATLADGQLDLTVTSARS